MNKIQSQFLDKPVQEAKEIPQNGIIGHARSVAKITDQTIQATQQFFWNRFFSVVYAIYLEVDFLVPTKTLLKTKLADSVGDKEFDAYLEHIGNMSYAEFQRKQSLSLSQEKLDSVEKTAEQCESILKDIHDMIKDSK